MVRKNTIVLNYFSDGAMKLIYVSGFLGLCTKIVKKLQAFYYNFERTSTFFYAIVSLFNVFCPVTHTLSRSNMFLIMP